MFNQRIRFCDTPCCVYFMDKEMLLATEVLS